MAMSQERATLYNTLLANPHKLLTFRDNEGTQHLLLHNTWGGWFTPCGLPLSSYEANLKHAVYGYVTCFECFGEEDPAEAGRHGRNTLKLYAKKSGNHWHVVIFMGALAETLVNVGGVTMVEFEWREFAAAMVIGAKSLGMHIIIERDE